jgi:sigma-B regulation protein RsbU (phosphoserine phosphatase)
MKSLRLLIVDDEPLIRTGIRGELSGLESVEVAGESGSVAEAVAAIRSNSFDLVLLDVQMPDGTGFDVIREVGAERMPPVVFVTAYDEYALRAFEVNAVDYLLKPFDDIRLRESINRAQARLPKPDERSHRMDALVEAHARAQAEMEVAGAVQHNLLPRRSSLVAGVEYTGRCAPASNLSGDYYDFLDLGSGRLGIVIADVSGKGLPAALLMANLQGCFRTSIRSGPPEPVALMSSINRLLYESTPPHVFATAFFGEYDADSHQLRYVNCGHLAPFVLRGQSGDVDRLEPTGTVLGAFPHWRSGDAVVRLDKNDALFLFTDGVTEATSASGEEFGEVRLTELLTSWRNCGAEGLVSKVLAEVQRFSSGAQHDDMTAVALVRV